MKTRFNLAASSSRKPHKQRYPSLECFVFQTSHHPQRTILVFQPLAMVDAMEDALMVAMVVAKEAVVEDAKIVVELPVSQAVKANAA